MGQKVNPVGLRLGINRGWDSVWYAKKKDFGNYLIEDFKIREYIKKNVINSGVSKVMIERTSNKCYVTIYTSRPGFVIGKKGSDIDKIKNNLSKFTKNEVTLNIKEVKKPETNAYLVAENIAQQLVKRISYRRAMKRAMQSCIRLGAKGIKVSVSGRLGGNEIARTEWLRDGSIQKTCCCLGNVININYFWYLCFCRITSKGVTRWYTATSRSSTNGI